MKIKKTAEQQNFAIDRYAYTVKELEAMELNHEITNLFPGTDEAYRLFCCDCKEVKVVCVDGFYRTIAVGKNERNYFITL